MMRRCALAFFVFLALGDGFQQDGDDAARISKLVNRFFQAIASKDLDAAAALLAADSPAFVYTREELRRLFAANRIGAAEARIERTAFPAPDRARTEVSASLDVYDTVSNLRPEGYGRTRRILDWVKVGGEWKIWRYAPVEAELADALIAAGSQAERTRLIAASKAMLTPALIRFLSDQADTAARSAHPEGALRLAGVAIEAAKTLNDDAALGWAEVRKAEILRGQSAYGDAKKLAQEGLDLFVRAKDRRGEAAAQWVAGSIHVLTAEYKTAWAELEASRDLARKIHDRSTEAAAIGQMGEFHRLHSQLSAAMKAFKDSLNLDRELGDRAGEAAEVANQANVLQMLGQFQGALNLYMQALDIDRDLLDKEGQAIDWGNIGTMREAMGDYKAAIDSLEKSRALKVEAADHHGLALTLNDLGLLLMNTGDLSSALERYTQSREVAREFMDKPAEENAVYNRGTALRYLGRFGEARQAAEESLRRATELEDPVSRAKSRGLLADLDNDAGRFQQAYEEFSAILPVFVQQKMAMEQAQTLHNIAATLQELGDYGQAELKYAECLRIQQGIWGSPGQDLTLNNLAQLSLARGDSQKAIEYASKGRAQAHSTGNRMAEALNTLALADGLQIAKRPEESLEAYNDAREIAENLGAPNAIAAAYIGIGSIHANEGQFDQSVKDCENAIAQVEMMRGAVGEPTLQAGFFSQNQKPYHCVINSLLALHRRPEALRTAERARARTLVEIMARGNVNLYRDLSPEDGAQLRKLDARVANLDAAVRYSQQADRARELKSALQARDELERAVYSRVPRLAVERGGAEPVDLDGLKSLLPDNKSALIEYVLEETGGWLFMVRGSAQQGGEPELFVRSLAVKRQAIGDLAESFWGRLKKKGDKGPEGRLLFDQLLGPIYSELKGVKSLGIVPDGRLWLVAFAALPDPKGSYLLDHYAIYYAPSFTALRAMERTTEARHQSLQARLKHGASAFLLLGNPWLGPSGKVDLPLRGAFEALPNTALELQGIAALPGVRARPVMDKEATEERVTQDADDYPVIHLATHAFFDPANPMDSGILLAQPPASKGDGVWEAREIVSRNLKASLVTVSACDTALGEILAGEGIVGLSWALFAAGAESSLLSEWRVFDASTPLLMKQFYNEWLAGDAKNSPRAKAFALQRAQKWMITHTPFTKPYFWAPFVLIGAPH